MSTIQERMQANKKRSIINVRADLRDAEARRQTKVYTMSDLQEVAKGAAAFLNNNRVLKAFRAKYAPGSERIAVKLTQNRSCLLLAETSLAPGEECRVSGPGATGPIPLPDDFDWTRRHLLAHTLKTIMACTGARLGVPDDELVSIINEINVIKPHTGLAGVFDV